MSSEAKRGIRQHEEFGRVYGCNGWASLPLKKGGGGGLGKGVLLLRDILAIEELGGKGHAPPPVCTGQVGCCDLRV